MLLTRLGVGKLILIDKDEVEESNLNRLHGATLNDVGKKKVEVLKSRIENIGLGTIVNVITDWVSSDEAINFLKESDFVFGCTDDHAGRQLLNRLAYFYLIPLIDMGLIISLKQNTDELQDLQGRISYIFPGADCLLTKGNISQRRAYEESLKRNDPEEYKKQKEEAYVIGEGNPAPSVVTFTTQLATIAVNQFLNRMVLFNPNGIKHHTLIFFNQDQQLTPGNIPDNDCRICRSKAYWGRGDMTPFMDMIL